MRTPFALGAVIVVLAGCAFVASSAASAAAPCWRAVLADWSRNGAVRGTYPPACLRAAMQNAPTDLRIYSTLEDDLQAALRSDAPRRLAGVHLRSASLAGSGSSSLPLLAGLIGGLGLLLGAGSIAGLVLRRRRG